MTVRPFRHPAIERATISPLVVCLLLAVLVLGVGEFAGARYLTHRQHVADVRAEVQRQGICAILDRFPTGNTALDVARADFRCGPPTPPRVPITPTPTPTRTPQPKPHATPTPQVIFTPARPRLILTPGPTVTVTRTPHPHKRKPHPAPNCTSIQFASMCLPFPPH